MNNNTNNNINNNNKSIHLIDPKYVVNALSKYGYFTDHEKSHFSNIGKIMIGIGIFCSGGFSLLTRNTALFRIPPWRLPWLLTSLVVGGSFSAQYLVYANRNAFYNALGDDTTTAYSWICPKLKDIKKLNINENNKPKYYDDWMVILKYCKEDGQIKTPLEHHYDSIKEKFPDVNINKENFINKNDKIDL